MDWVRLAQDRVYCRNFEKILIKLEVRKAIYLWVDGWMLNFQQSLYFLKPDTYIWFHSGYIYAVSPFGVLTAAVSVKVTVFWNVTSFISVVNLQSFGGSCGLRNFSTCLPDYELLHLWQPWGTLHSMFGNMHTFCMFAYLLCLWITNFKTVRVLKVYWRSVRRTCMLSRALPSWRIDPRLRCGLLQTSDQLMGRRRASPCGNQFSSFGMYSIVPTRLWNIEVKFPDLRKELSSYF